jgi:hypothetical protein
MTNQEISGNTNGIERTASPSATSPSNTGSRGAQAPLFLYRPINR